MADPLRLTSLQGITLLHFVSAAPTLHFQQPVVLSETLLARVHRIWA